MLKTMCLKTTFNDYRETFNRLTLLFHMSLNEVKRRYARTVLGPMWAALSVSIFLLALGVMYTHLWKMEVREFFPFLSAGLTFWFVINNTVTESGMVFITANSIINQIRLPYMLFVGNLLLRNFIVFLHMLPICFIVNIAYNVPLNLHVFLLLPGITLALINGVWLSLLIGLLCSRFRDFLQIMSNILQITFFMTPIFWMPNQIKSLTMTKLLVNFNPAYHIIELIRKPLLGQMPEINSWLYVIILGILGNFIAFFIFSIYRKKLIFWL